MYTLLMSSAFLSMLLTPCVVARLVCVSTDHAPTIRIALTPESH